MSFSWLYMIDPTTMEDLIMLPTSAVLTQIQQQYKYRCGSIHNIFHFPQIFEDKSNDKTFIEKDITTHLKHSSLARNYMEI